MSSSEKKENEERARAIVQTLAAVVEPMIQRSDSLPLAYYPRTKFDAFRAPGISVRDYLMRIHKYASCSPECFVLALVYIDRLHQMQGLILTELNVHRVLITCVVLAAKFFDDHYFNNAYYAKVGGVPCVEMNQLEVELLLMINFSLHVTSETYIRYYNELSNHYIFISIRNASIPAAAYRRFRHYVTADPEQDGKLVYVTEVVPEDPPYAYTQYPYSFQQYSHPQYLPPYHPQPHQKQLDENEQDDPENSSPTNMSSNVYDATRRTSGQKRRQSVALGVNA